MATSKRLHPVVEWIVAEDMNRTATASSTPKPEEIDEAYAYAVENDCVVKLCWTPCGGYAAPHSCYVHANTDVVALKDRLAHIMYGV